MSHRPEVGAGVADRDLSDATVLVTGSTSGIGREAAVAFGRLGAEVLVHGRDETAGREVVRAVERAGGSGTFFRADFADSDAVARLAHEVREHVTGDAGTDGERSDGDAGSEPSVDDSGEEAGATTASDGLDVLANNAGAYFREGRLAEGVERTFRVNHLAAYRLTAALLPVLAADARVVTTSSGAHRGDQIDLDAVTSVADYGAWRAYQRSKLANVQFTAELGRRFAASDTDRVANCFHPGAIPGSGFFRFLPRPLSDAARLAGKLPFVTSPADGAETLVYLAAGDVTANGRYFADCAPRTPADPARDPDAQRRLWEWSAETLGIEEPLAEVREAVADGAGDD